LIIIFQLPTAFQSKHLELSTGGALAFPLVELVILVPVLWIGKIRGWSVTTFGSRISWKGTGGGLLLFVVAETASIGVTLGAQIIHPEQSPFTVGRLAVLAVLLISIINPFFEEVLETGYFIHSLQKIRDVAGSTGERPVPRAFPPAIWYQRRVKRLCVWLDIWVCLLAVATTVAAYRRPFVDGYACVVLWQLSCGLTYGCTPGKIH